MEQQNDAILMQHNIETYNNASKMLEKHGKVAIVQPTGTGKSYIAMRIMQDYSQYKKIVLAPSRDFLTTLENSEFWDKSSTYTFTYQYLVRYRDNIEHVIKKVTDDESEIGIIIIDELHRVGAKYWQKAVVNLINNCPNAVIVGLTATPIRYRDSRDMVEEMFSGVSVGNTSIADAISSGVLPKLKYIVSVGDVRREIARLRAKYDRHSVILGDRLNECNRIRDTWNRESIYKTTLNKYITKNDGKYMSGLESKHIVFMPSISELESNKEKIKEWFEEVYAGYTIKMLIAHSDRLKSQNTADLVEFTQDTPKNTVFVMLSVQMLNESFHFNGVKTITMFRHTEAVNLFIQQIGRGLTAKSETPYILDFVDNFECVGEIALLAGRSESFTDGTAVLFEEFIDETIDCIDELQSLRRRLDARIAMYNNCLIDYVRKYEVLSNIPHIGLRNWAVEQYKLLRYQRSTLIDKHRSEFELNDFVIIFAGTEWWTELNSFNNLNDSLKEKFLEKTRQCYILGQLKDSVKNYIFDKIGVDISIGISNRYLFNIIKKSNRTECKAVVRLLNAIENKDVFGVYDGLTVYNHFFNADNNDNIVFGSTEIDRAACRMLIDRLKVNKKYGLIISMKHPDDEVLLYNILKAKKQKRNYILLDVNGFELLNKRILRSNLESQSEFVKGMIKNFHIDSAEKLYKYVDDTCGMSMTINNIKDKAMTYILNCKYSNCTNTGLSEMCDTFINNFGSIDMCDYFKDKYGWFEKNVLPLVAKATNDSKYYDIDAANDLVNSMISERDKQDKIDKLISENMEIYKDAMSSIKYMAKKYGFDIDDPKSITKVVDILIEDIDNIGSSCIASGKSLTRADTSRMQLVYKLYKLHRLGIPGYSDVERIIQDDRLLKTLDLALIRERVRDKLTGTIKFMSIGLDFKRAAFEAKLTSSINDTDSETIDLITSAEGINRDGELYYILNNIYSLPLEYNRKRA